MDNFAAQLDGWVPVRVVWQNGLPYFSWTYFGERRFTESFFDYSVEAQLKTPLNLFLQPLSPIETLRECDQIRPGMKPDGFIFHLSRCGSTLISQMLAASPKNVVISEGAPIDWMIRARVRNPNISTDQQIEWLRLVVSALGQKRGADSGRYFIKLDAWNIFNFELIKQAFPDVPWIFLYRDPLEVLVSHTRQRGGGTVPGMVEHELPGMQRHEVLGMDANEYSAIFLRTVCEYALKFQTDPLARLVNYTELPEFATTKFQEHFKVTFDTAEIDAMNAAAKFNAKSPRTSFSSDVEEKRREASDELRMISDSLLLPVYQKLEAIRLQTTAA